METLAIYCPHCKLRYVVHWPKGLQRLFIATVRCYLCGKVFTADFRVEVEEGPVRGADNG